MSKKREAVVKTDRTLRLIRCFEESVNAFVNGQNLPLALCYHRSKVYYKLDESFISSDPNVYLFDSPVSTSEDYQAILNNFEYLNSDHVIDRHVVEYLVSNGCTKINSFGRWILITRVKVG